MKIGRAFNGESYDIGLQFKDSAGSLFMEGYVKPVFSQASKTAWKSGDSVSAVALSGIMQLFSSISLYATS